MRLRAHHWPEMPHGFDVIVLGKRRLGDVLQRFSGGVRQEVQVQLHRHGHEPVDNMGMTASVTCSGGQAGLRAVEN